MNKEEQEAIEYFDNTIKKLHKAREELQEMSNNNISKTIKDTIEFWQHKCFDLQKELDKKDKVIDLMAKSWKQDDIRSVEKIKDYFYKKVEEENE